MVFTFSSEAPSSLVSVIIESTAFISHTVAFGQCAKASDAEHSNRVASRDFIKLPPSILVVLIEITEVQRQWQTEIIR
jgi:hypothetical protein